MERRLTPSSSTATASSLLTQMTGPLHPPLQSSLQPHNYCLPSLVTSSSDFGSDDIDQPASTTSDPPRRSSMSSRLSRVLFRDNDVESSEVDIPGITIDSDFTIDQHKTSDVEEPSSPFKLTYSKTTCSSPTTKYSLQTGVEELKLISSPQTPKTIVRRGQFRRALRPSEGGATRSSTRSSGRGVKRSLLTPRTANVNPFTPTGVLLHHQSKTKRSKFNQSFSLVKDSSDSSCVLTTDPDDGSEENEAVFDDVKWSSESDPLSNDNVMTLAINGGGDDCAILSRYVQDFIEIEKIGAGDFGCVFKCLNRLDGCVYAIKQSRKPTKGSSTEKKALNEVYAHAVLGKHRRVVHYFSAWAEEDRMYIQNEYCEGRSLSSVLEEYRNKNKRMSEFVMKRILLQVSQGLKYIHSQNLAHMDIKPENIFLTKKLDVENDACNSDHNKSTQSFLDDGFEDDSDSECGDEVSFKIGDFGLVAISTGREVEEGDCRYMAPELLNEDIVKDLAKSDVYALGMTLIECVNGTPLPKNGQEWHEIRKPEHLSLEGISSDLAALIKKMIDLDPHQRPSASFIIQQPEVHTSLDKSRAQLKRELNSSIAKIKELTEQLKEAEEKRAILQSSFMSTTSTADDVVCLQGSLTK